MSSVCVERPGSGQAFRSSVGAAWSAIYVSRADQVKANCFSYVLVIGSTCRERGMRRVVFACHLPWGVYKRNVIIFELPASWQT
jgi:hypothetical protein